jgi:CTP:molybdopterin cytidylyltransferase MocA
MSPAVDCIVPAAGRSERMGRWKPVLPFGCTRLELAWNDDSILRDRDTMEDYE